jgi:hypothetical protein
MLNKWFGKEEMADLAPNGSEQQSGNGARPAESSEQVKKLPEAQVASPDWPTGNGRRPANPPAAPGFEQIYQTAAVKPPKLTYGIQKVAEMGSSPHLAGMSKVFKRKALLMALEAAGTDVGQVLNDVVTRQRALKEYEDSFQEKVSQFEAEQLEQNRLHKAELDRITAQYKARMDASLAEIERWQKDFRDWQKLKQQELQRLTEAAGLCVQHEAEEEEDEISENKVMAFTQRAGGAER